MVRLSVARHRWAGPVRVRLWHGPVRARNNGVVPDGKALALGARRREFDSPHPDSRHRAWSVRARLVRAWAGQGFSGAWQGEVSTAPRAYHQATAGRWSARGSRPHRAQPRPSASRTGWEQSAPGTNRQGRFRSSGYLHSCSWEHHRHVGFAISGRVGASAMARFCPVRQGSGWVRLGEATTTGSGLVGERRVRDAETREFDSPLPDQDMPGLWRVPARHGPAALHAASRVQARFRQVESWCGKSRCGGSGHGNQRDMAQVGSASGWGPEGRRFESGYPDSNRAIGLVWRVVACPGAA